MVGERFCRYLTSSVALPRNCHWVSRCRQAVLGRARRGPTGSSGSERWPCDGVCCCPLSGPVARVGEDDCHGVAVAVGVLACRGVDRRVSAWRGAVRGVVAAVGVAALSRARPGPGAAGFLRPADRTGRRDLAILTLLLRLGLRAGEVAGLSLEDVDWRAGELVVVGKGRRAERLPLPVDVGGAITSYLRDGRPGSALDRTVFIRVKAPHRRLSTGGITQVVFAASYTQKLWMRVKRKAAYLPGLIKNRCR